MIREAFDSSQWPRGVIVQFHSRFVAIQWVPGISVGSAWVGWRKWYHIDQIISYSAMCHVGGAIGSLARPDKLHDRRHGWRWVAGHRTSSD